MVVVPLFALFSAARAMAVASVKFSAASLQVRMRSPSPASTVKVLFFLELVYSYLTPV